jgi:hypothetical protein
MSEERKESTHKSVNKEPSINKLIEEIELRWKSGNSIPIERVHIRHDEWLLIRKHLQKS